MSTTTINSAVVAVFEALKENGNKPVTAQEAGIDAVTAHRLVKAEVLKPVGRRQTGRRGRPAHEFRLTDKARKRAKRLAAAA